jgi:iron complex outermembrane receptor protein
MTIKPNVAVYSERNNAAWLVRVAVAAVISGNCAMAAEPAATDTKKDSSSGEVTLAEVQVTGSRIIRKDLESNSPLVTIDQQKIEDSPYISVEEALNDLPQFMVGGAGLTTAAVTSLQGANGVDGGRGTGDASNSTLLPDNAGIIGIVVPGAANVNLRGLGAGRSLTLVNGHRGMPENAGMTIDLNTIPSIAMGGIEVISGGASAVYGADALAGVTNIRLRENFEGLRVTVKGGINEVGDGGEMQVGGLMGAKIADGRGSAMIGIEYNKRNPTLWRKHPAFKEVLESPYSSAGDYLFGWDSYYSPSTSSSAGQYFPFLGVWAGNQPTTAASLSIFPNRTCGTANCITNAFGPIGGGYYVNQDGTVYTRASQGPLTNGVVTAYGPQNYRPLPNAPVETTCSYAAPTVNATTGAVTSQTIAAPSTGQFAGAPCSPTQNRIDWGRRMEAPRTGYSLVGNANYKINDNFTAFANFNFAASDTQTRREPAPFSGPTFGVAIPFAATDVNGNSPIYLPSVVNVGSAAAPVGSTVTSYRVGGTKGTNCPATGGCSMAQAFPLPGDVFDANGRVITKGGLRILLESRTTPAGNIASGAFQGLPNNCTIRAVATASTPGAVLNPANGTYYVTQLDPNTNLPLTQCGPNSRWALNTQLSYLPPRGTNNSTRLYNFATGLRGDTGIGDWTWEYYMSYGDAKTSTDYSGFASLANYARLMTAPNYGQGFDQVGISSKYQTCASGLAPFNQSFSPSADCMEDLSANETDRSNMTQRIHELTAQGGLFDLPAGQVRSALGLSYRKNDFTFKPDSLRELDYIGDTSAGAFGSGAIDAGVTAKEVYGELLVPLLKDVPAIQRLELELGYRHSDYSTGQKVDTYKILANWSPVEWLRLRGGYNRAERAPNIAELYQTPTGSAQFADGPIDPCRNDAVTGGLNTTVFNGRPSNQPATDPTTRIKLQQLCSAMIGNSASAFDADPNNFNDAGAPATLLNGNQNLKNERGDTWTVGFVFRSPFTGPLVSRLTSTVDWYEVRVSDPIDVTRTAAVVNSCYNINGANPTLSIDDPAGYCKLIQRDQVSGAISRVFNPYENQDLLVIRGIDVGANWTVSMSDLGFESLPGSVSVALTGNYLMTQKQRYSGSADKIADYAGYNGASKIRGNTTVGYNWGNNRVSLTWVYRLATKTPTTYAATANIQGTQTPTIQENPLMAGYPSSNQVNGTYATKLGPVKASFNVSNLLNTRPQWGGYDWRDPQNGFGSFSPFDDANGRRYSVNLSVDF